MTEETFYKAIGSHIRKFREEYKGKMTQGDLSKVLGVSSNTVSRWELGVYKPSIYHLAKIEELFNISLHLPSFLTPSE